MIVRLRFLPLLGFMVIAFIPLSDGAEVSDADMLAPFSHPKGYVCYRAPSRITIDGKLDDPAWEAAPWTDAFADIEGDKQPKPRYRTRVKMLWDDEALYIAAELDDPHVWATLTEHDSVIFKDNDFEVFIDPDGDNHLYGELELNAKNTTWDLLLTKPYKDQGKPVTAWEVPGLKTAVHVNGTLNDPGDKDTGWTVEIKWPWTGWKELTEPKFPLPPQNGNQWRINFSRVEWDIDIVEGKYRKIPNRPEHNWVWSPQGVIDMHRPERWGFVQFSTAKPGKDEFRPELDWPARDLLHRAYYAEKAYHKKHGKYTSIPGDLAIQDAGKLRLEATRNTFEISTELPAEKGAKPRRMTISTDARIAVE